MVKKRKFETLESLLARLWCYYCEKDFDNDRELIDHQKSKHFQCGSCKKRLQTANGLAVHVNNVHKLTVEKIENALPGRESTKVEIFGMMGIPEDLLEEKRGEVIRRYEAYANEYRAKTGNPLPGSAEAEERSQKAPRLKETKEERQARLREHIALKKAQKEGKVVAGSPGSFADAAEASTASPDNAATPQQPHDPFQPPAGVVDGGAPYYPQLPHPAGFAPPTSFGMPQPPIAAPYTSQSPFGQPHQYPPPGPYGFAGPQYGVQNGLNGTHVSYSSPQPPVSAPYSMPPQSVPSGFGAGSLNRPRSRGQDSSPFNGKPNKASGSRSNSLPSAADLPPRPAVSMDNITMEDMKAYHPHTSVPQQDFPGSHFGTYRPPSAPGHEVVDDIDRKIAELTGQGAPDPNQMPQPYNYQGMSAVSQPMSISYYPSLPSKMSPSASVPQSGYGLPSRPSTANNQSDFAAPSATGPSKAPDVNSHASAPSHSGQQPVGATTKAANASDTPPPSDRILARLNSRLGFRKEKHGKYSMMVYSSETSPEEARYYSTQPQKAP